MPEPFTPNLSQNRCPHAHPTHHADIGHWHARATKAEALLKRERTKSREATGLLAELFGALASCSGYLHERVRLFLETGMDPSAKATLARLTPIRDGAVHAAMGMCPRSDADEEEAPDAP